MEYEELEKKCKDLERKLYIASNYGNISDYLLINKHNSIRCPCTRWIDISKNNNSKCNRCDTYYCDNLKCSIQCDKCARSYCKFCEDTAQVEGRDKFICDWCTKKDNHKIINELVHRGNLRLCKYKLEDEECNNIIYDNLEFCKRCENRLRVIRIKHQGKKPRCQYVHKSGIRCINPISNFGIRNSDKFCIECIQNTENW